MSGNLFNYVKIFQSIVFHKPSLASVKRFENNPFMCAYVIGLYPGYKRVSLQLYALTCVCVRNLRTWSVPWLQKGPLQLCAFTCVTYVIGLYPGYKIRSLKLCGFTCVYVRNLRSWSEPWLQKRTFIIVCIYMQREDEQNSSISKCGVTIKMRTISLFEQNNNISKCWAIFKKRTISFLDKDWKSFEYYLSLNGFLWLLRNENVKGSFETQTINHYTKYAIWNILTEWGESPFKVISPRKI